jgi:hypothetical protein
MMPPGTMHETEDVATGEDLARFLDPAGVPFTLVLLKLAVAANATQRAALREAFPAQVITWEIWSQLEEIPSAGDLRALAGMIWPSNLGVPGASLILDLLTDYKHGRITLPARAES